MTGATIPATMREWHGGDSAPADWDGGPVLGDDGGWYEWDEDGGLDWRHGLSARDVGADIIAYTPIADQPSPPVVEGREAIARIIDPDAWHNTLPGDGCGEYWMFRRSKAFAKADAILATLRAGGEVREADLCREALEAVADAMLMGGDGSVGDYGWSITKLNRARSLIRAALAPAAGGEGV